MKDNQLSQSYLLKLAQAAGIQANIIQVKQSKPCLLVDKDGKPLTNEFK